MPDDLDPWTILAEAALFPLSILDLLTPSDIAQRQVCPRCAHWQSVNSTLQLIQSESAGQE